jgi:hypothetical protein
MAFGINPRYLLDAIESCLDDRGVVEKGDKGLIELHCIGPRRPVMVTDGTSSHVIMPCRLEGFDCNSGPEGDEAWINSCLEKVRA